MKQLVIDIRDDERVYLILDLLDKVMTSGLSWNILENDKSAKGSMRK